MNALLQVLDPNVAGHADSGGIFPSSRAPQPGRARMAVIVTHFVRLLGLTCKPTAGNGDPGVLALKGNRLPAVVGLESRSDLVTQIHIIANPYKLAYAASLLNVETVQEGEFTQLLAAAAAESGGRGPSDAASPA